MLIEDIICFECGGNATTGEHKENCLSVFLMNTYCNLLEDIKQYPDKYLDKLKVAIYTEQTEREIYSGSYKQLEEVDDEQTR